MGAVVLAGALLVSARGAAGGAPPEVALSRAVRLYGDLQGEEAAALLRRLLRRQAPPGVCARAHLYLGLIALNFQADSDGAKAEFGKAMAADPLVELPVGVGPKARIVFEQARREVAFAPRPAVAPAPVSPPAPAPGGPPSTGMAARPPAVTRAPRAARPPAVVAAAPLVPPGEGDDPDGMLAIEPRPAPKRSGAASAASSSPWPWVLGVGGGVLAAAGGVAWGLDASARGGYAGRGLEPMKYGAIQASNTEAVLGDVLVPVGAVLLGVALVLALGGGR